MKKKKKKLWMKKAKPPLKEKVKAEVETRSQLKVVMLLKNRTQDLNNAYPGGIRKPWQEIFRYET
jgi:ssRNA-specific RNase YbeY (16S rRNA maturation enzyme)